MNIKQQYALVRFEIAVLENYNPIVLEESDDLGYLEEKMNDYMQSKSVCEDFTIIEKHKGEIRDYYTGELFDMNQYT